MIKEVSILQNNMEITEEKKGLFGVKSDVYKIDLLSIDKIEKMIKDNELIGFTLWNKDEVIYAIGIKNYENSIEELFNKIINNIDNNSIEIISTTL